jgi:ribosomal protein L37AE/L43A
MVCPSCKETVTRLRFVEKEWLCPSCAPAEAKPRQNAKSHHFPFRTRNIRSDGSEVEVKSLRHLRRLENQNHVQSGAWN